MVVRYIAEQATRDKLEAVRGHLNFLKSIGRPLPNGARILDFGCGVGHSVAVALELGLDAYGADIKEWWGADHAEIESFYGVTYTPSPEVAQRLFVFKTKLPFPDHHFDFCFSDQVMEHVFDHVSAFREIGRVLKPGAISLHRFPGPNGLVEGHTSLPLPALCQNFFYRGVFAVLGIRAPSQKGWSLRDTLADNAAQMATVNFRTKRQIFRDAERAGVQIEFLERQELGLRRTGRAAAILARAGWLSEPARFLIGLFAQRYMALYPAGNGHFWPR